MSSPSAPHLQQFTGYLLRLAYVKSAGAARDCIPEDAHIREVAILSILAEQGAMSQRALSEVTHVNRSLIVKLIDSLEAKEWVIRDRNRDDRRAYALLLTPAGEDALAKLNDDLDRGEAELNAALTAAEVTGLKSRLRELLVDDPALTVTSLTDRTGYLITHAHYRLHGWATQGLEPLGLHPRDFGVLMTIAREEPCSQTQLATALGISSPAALGFLDDLETLGYVSRSRNAEDRRLLALTLTEAGNRCLARARHAATGVQAQVAARLGAAGDAELRALLSKLLAQ